MNHLTEDALIVAIPTFAMAIMALVMAASDHMLMSFFLIAVGVGIAQMQRRIER